MNLQKPDFSRPGTTLPLPGHTCRERKGEPVTRAVIFDLDGTLTDTLDDLSFSVNTILARHGFPVHEKDAYKVMVGNGMRALIRRVLPEGTLAGPPASPGNEALVEALRQEASGFYALHALDRTRAYSGIPELLDTLDSRKIPYAVLSNKPDALARAVVSGVFPARKFFAVRGESAAFPPKPDPASAIDLAKKMGIPAGDIAYIGDSDVDIFTARNAGMKSAGAAWGFRGKRELEEAGADIILSHPLDLIAVL